LFFHQTIPPRRFLKNGFEFADYEYESVIFQRLQSFGFLTVNAYVTFSTRVRISGLKYSFNDAHDWKLLQYLKKILISINFKQYLKPVVQYLIGSQSALLLRENPALSPED
jgi:hypothetical protein